MARYDWERGYGRTGGYDSSYDGWDAGWRSGAGGSRGVNWGGYRPRPWSDEGGGSRFGGGYDRGVYGSGYPTFGGYPGGRQQGMYYGGSRYGGEYGNPAHRGYDRGMGFRDAGPGYGPGGGFGAGGGAYHDGSAEGPGFGRGGFGYDMDSGYGRTERSGFGGQVGYGGGSGMGRGGSGPGRGGYDAGYARGPFVPEEAYRRHPEMERPRDHARGGWPDQGRDADFEEELDDAEVEQGVRGNLHQDGWIQADAIEVEVNEGVVTLRGEVEDYMQARYAWDDAWDSAGVRGVINHLTVRTDEPHQTHGDVVPQSSGGKK